MVKLVSVALICSLLIIYLKSINSDMYSLALIASGIIIVSIGLEYLFNTFELLNELVELSGIDKNTYGILLKITAIGYLVEFGAGTVEDMGLKNLSDKMVFVGKAIIISVSLPIFYSVLSTLYGLLT